LRVLLRAPGPSHLRHRGTSRRGDRTSSLTERRAAKPFAATQLSRRNDCSGAAHEGSLGNFERRVALTEAPMPSFDWGGGPGAWATLRAGLPRDAHRTCIRAQNRCRASPMGKVTRGGRSRAQEVGVAWGSWAVFCGGIERRRIANANRRPLACGNPVVGTRASSATVASRHTAPLQQREPFCRNRHRVCWAAPSSEQAVHGS